MAGFIEMAKSNTGPRDLSQETRDKLSRAASNRKANLGYTKGIGGTREDVGHYVRSTWEANWARYLKCIGKSYRYEPEAFLLDDDGKPFRYTPDFKVDNEYYEVKGWWTERSIRARSLMEKQRPEVIIHYIGEKEYREIEREYGKQIPTWEFKQRRA